MKIAIPVAEGKLTMHFGHCPAFAVLDVDMNEKKITHREDIPAPAHEPGLLPVWLADKGVNMVIAGGIGKRAVDLLVGQGIQVILGAAPDTPEQIVSNHLTGILQTGDNPCGHGEGEHDCSH